MTQQTNRKYDRVEGGFDLFLGSIMLLQVTYTYCKMRGLRNLSFMNRLLFLIFIISITCIYAGAVLIARNPADWEAQKAIFYTNLIVNIVFEISSAMVIWIVGFKFIDSATQLEAIETHFEERIQKTTPKLGKNKMNSEIG